jgi:hypothetical protein
VFFGEEVFLEPFEGFLAGDFEELEVADCEKVHADVEERERGEVIKGQIMENEGIFGVVDLVRFWFKSNKLLG